MTWGGPGPQRAKFISSTNVDSNGCNEDEAAAHARSSTNAAIRHAFKLLRSEAARVDGQLLNDFQSLMEGECIYLPGFFGGGHADLGVMQGLTNDLQNFGREGMVDWSKHLKFDNPEFSPTFQNVIHQLDQHFDVEILASRLNFYRDGSDWKPFHHDSHAYGANGKKEDFTVGASFGGGRELAFKHPASGHEFTIPQNNGDIFAFTSEVNKRFQHGVPRAKTLNVGPRFSIIAWGRRRTVNCRNGGPAHVPAPMSTSNQSLPPSSSLITNDISLMLPPSDNSSSKAPAVLMADVNDLVQQFVATTQHGHMVKEQRKHQRKRRSDHEYNGQTYANLKHAPEDEAVSGAYELPRFPVTRTGAHKTLVRDLKLVLGSKYHEFRNAGVSYQHGCMSADEFCDIACRLLGFGQARLLVQAVMCMPDSGGRQDVVLQKLRLLDSVR
mmetsp:Transcript_47878/g.89175  ORF Transcript_47878/g.89175 Transcript_47878/m.89175 type:complete len:440 (+) Transcript_47878:48-1367(+)